MGDHPELRIQLAAEPVSVSAARRFVTDGLVAWRLDGLVDDAELCVSELASNAALHSTARFMHVAMRRTGDAVRISVEDDGVVPAAALLPRPSFPDPEDPGELLLEDEATTGRGLAIVSIVASDWGVDETERGKRVWADIDDADDGHGVRLPKTGAAPASGTTAGPTSGPASGPAVRGRPTADFRPDGCWYACPAARCDSASGRTSISTSSFASCS